jgi:hypothetical protein
MIQSTWHPDRDEPYPGKEAAYCQTMARMRALRGVAALRQTSRGSEMPEALIRDSRTLAGWRSISTKR